MRFDLTELAGLAGAVVLSWPGRDRALQPVHEPDAAGPGAVFFPPYASDVTPALLETLGRNGAAGIALYESTVPRLCASDGSGLPPGLGALAMASPFRGFTALAAEARRRTGAAVVGITGSAGKSATTEYLRQILAEQRPVIATHGNRNLLVDCAGLLLRLTGAPGETAVVEMGFGWAGDIERMAALARPDAGLILNVTAAHLDGTGGSWERLIAEKGRLGAHIPAAGILAVHAEDPGCARLPYSAYVARVLRFGAGPAADVRYSGVRASEAGTEIELDLFGHALVCRLRAHGGFRAANAAAAALVAHVLGASAAAIRAGLENTPPVPGRFQVFRYERGLTVIDDAFNATVEGMLRGLEEGARLAGQRRRCAVLSGVARLGARSADVHRIIGRHLVRCGYGELILVRDAWSPGIREGALAAGLPAERVWDVAANAELPETLLRHAGPDCLMYCKARYAGAALDAFRTGLGSVGFQLAGPP